MEGVDGADAGEGHVNHVAGAEAVFTEPFSVPLRQHVNDVGRRWFRTVKGRFGSKVHPTDASRVEAVSVDELHHGHGAHGSGVFVNVRDGHGFKPEAFAEFAVIRSSKVCEILHVHVETRKMDGNVVNSDGGVTFFGHVCSLDLQYMKGRFQPRAPSSPS